MKMWGTLFKNYEFKNGNNRALNQVQGPSNWSLVQLYQSRIH